MDLQVFREQLFTEGEKLGFSDLEIYYEKLSSFGCQIYEGEIDDYRSSTVNGVSARGIINGKMGEAFTEKLDDASVSFLLHNMIENANISEDEPGELFDGKAEYEDLNFFSPTLSEVTIEEKIEFLKQVEKHIYDYDPRVVQTGYAAIQDQLIEKALFNNKGLELNDKNNFLFFVFSVVVKENDETKSDYYFKIVDDFSSVDPRHIAKEACEKSLRLLGGKSYPNKSYPVILESNTACELLAVFTPAFSAKSVQDDQSRLKDKLNTTITADVLTLQDNPHLTNGIRSSTFDSEGVPTKPLTVVENGVLKTYFHNLKTAKKDGVKSTGHGHKLSYRDPIGVRPSNFYVVPSEVSKEELYSDLKEGIIITSLSGLHSGANSISGDFSLAAEGFYVKNGKIASPTNKMTIAGNFFDLLKDVEKVASDLEFSPMDFYGYIGSPSLKIKELAVTID
ncbi:TldD/PmbA family protein [Ornithinibacillus halotolerans]|uniref:Peptidase n=1 Tax=Ornithinibacillus halotolerans TaxID=1274357 RepID=A0A916S378_9BACI|nr:TldD/PmbA family protein [Ornithinibacillus halotolerans]GGA81240.1 peptidase [Ornithinibacillus halotolerans]